MQTEILELFSGPLGRLLIHENEAQFFEDIKQVVLFEPQLIELRNDTNELKNIANMFYNSVPLSSKHFEVIRQEPPNRNDPCFCGSGKKFKKCCEQTFSMPTVQPEMFFTFALSGLQEDQWQRVAKKCKWPLNLVQIFVGYAVENGQFMAAIDCTEPHLADIPHWKKPQQELVAYILDAMFEIGLDEQRENLMNIIAEQCQDKSLKALGYQRLAMRRAEEGKLEDAQDLFRKALRLDPNQPELPLTELSILNVAGSDSEIRSRALFWRKKISKKHGDDSDIIGLLDEVIANGKAVLNPFDFSLNDDPDDLLHELEHSWLNAEPVDTNVSLQKVFDVVANQPTKLVYDVNIKGNEGQLTLKPGMRAKVKKWRQLWEQNAIAAMPFIEDALPISEDEGYSCRWFVSDDSWLDYILECPEIIDDFTVLGELVQFVYLYPGDMEQDLYLQLEDVINQRMAHIVFEFVDQLPGTFTLPSRFKANQPFWQLASGASLNLYDPGDNDLYFQKLEQLTKLDNDLQPWLESQYIQHRFEIADYKIVVKFYETLLTPKLNSWLFYICALFADGHSKQAMENYLKFAKKFIKTLKSIRVALENEDPFECPEYELFEFISLLLEENQSQTRNFLLRQLPK